MTEIEMAIDAIETAFEQEPPAIVEDGHGFYLVIEDALATALAALREQAEREKWCEYCEDHTPNDSQFYDAEGELGAKFLYCPMCGKRLEVEHDEA